MRKNKILYGRQHIDRNDIKKVQLSLKENFITTGKYVRQFEVNLKKKFKSKFAISCSSGTAGLHLAFLSLDLKKGDIVIMPSINFISSYRVAELMGAKIFLSDVDPISGQMTPETLEQCIKKNKIRNVKAIVTMYLGGYIKNNIEFFKIKKRLGCALIEDACHAIGGTYMHKRKKNFIGSCKHSDICVFSFHPVKTITTGEGGAITTNNKSLAKRMIELRSHGILRKNKYWEYDIKNLGYNYRLSDINCSLGVSQLNRLEKFSQKRKKIFNVYNKLLSPYKKFFNFVENPNRGDSYHFYLISIKFNFINSNKDKLFRYLNSKGIYPQFHYIPIFKFSFFKKKNKSLYKGANNFYKNSLSLPMFYNLTTNKQIFIIKKIINFIKSK